MLSIGIPVYNHDIRNLVHDLHEQGEQLNKPFEILCYDDRSASRYHQNNQSITELSRVRYQRMEENKGVCAIRNQLMQDAQYENILLIDADMKVDHPEYLTRYIPYFGQEMVVFGGIRYEKFNDDPERLFRWYYGKQREEKPVSVRQTAPYLNFMSQQFLIHQSVVSQIQFDERLPTPGHDDTLFGYRLKEANIPLKHINNPLIHTGIPSIEEFLQKTTNALSNLKQILTFPNIDAEAFSHHVRLLHTYQQLRSWRLTQLYSLFFKLWRPIMQGNLRSGSPSLKLFDLYRLGQWIEIAHSDD